VVWPSRDEAVKMTVFVIIFVAILAAFIYVADTIISWLFFDVLLNRKG
jgi:preprotein translocase, secE subunit